MKKVILAALTFAPAITFAQSLTNLNTLLVNVGDLIDVALPIVVAIALLAFFWGIVKFIFGGETAKKEGQQLMIWGLVGLFVMVSVWGLVRFIGYNLGIGQADTITVPRVPGI